MKGIMSFVAGAVMGGLVGATLAILLAPASGEDMRDDFQERIQRLQSEVENAASIRRAEMERQLAELRAPKKAGA